MKRTNRLILRVSDPDNLRLAFWKAQRGKSQSDQVAVYRKNLDQNLMMLREQILSGDIQVGNYRYFKVFEPKERQICAAAFGEQVLHHALMNVCHYVFERQQIFDSYASRPGKGNHAALARAQVFTRKYNWYLKLDVRKFFSTIHHYVVKRQLASLFKEASLLEIFGKIIDSFEDEPDRGLPIGNLTSQYFANHYLVGLDRYIKGVMQMPAYVRYMDDIVLWNDDKSALKWAQRDIRHFIESDLWCSLKPMELNRTSTGLPFLGYHLFPRQTRLLQKSKQRFIKKYNRAEACLTGGIWKEPVYQRHIFPLLNFTRYANAHAFRGKILGQLP